MAVISPHSPKAVETYVEELKMQTDRGAGIVAAAVVEEALEFTIKRRLIELSNSRADSLFGRMRPLSSFSAKTELGFALGLYDDKLRHPLNMIRDIQIVAPTWRPQFRPSRHRKACATRALVPEPAKQSPLQKYGAFSCNFFVCYVALLLLRQARQICRTRAGETHRVFAQLALLRKISELRQQ
jgi:hypothetical protein